MATCWFVFVRLQVPTIWWWTAVRSTAFTNLAVGQKIDITTYYSPSQLKYTGTNNLYWSAMASARPPGNIWVTRPRTSLNTQSTPWPCKNSSQQGSAASQIDSIGDDASQIAVGGDPNGTSPANGNSFVVEPEGSSIGGSFNSYSVQIGANGNLAGYFWGDSSSKSLEQSTPANFTTAGQPVRADFYQLLSASNGLPANYLGYFELSTNGVLTYTAGPSPTTLTAPRIVSYHPQRNHQHHFLHHGFRRNLHPAGDEQRGVGHGGNELAGHRFIPCGQRPDEFAGLKSSPTVRAFTPSPRNNTKPKFSKANKTTINHPKRQI